MTINCDKYQNLPNYLAQHQPEHPVYCFRQKPLHTAASWFNANFNGKVLYAVKANPHPFVLKTLINAGIKSFDVASLNEITLVHDIMPNAEMYFMHPVKNLTSIRESYFRYFIKNYALDSFDELEKIMEATHNAKDLNLFVRLNIPNNYSKMELSSKFGVAIEKAVQLIKAVRGKAYKLGICFHVGSQCMHPDAYNCALKIVSTILKQAETFTDIIDIGGGFPSIYPGLHPPPLDSYINEINKSIKSFGFQDSEKLCEPGRALVAESGSALVKVELRKDHHLYINDGTYGSLFDACRPRFVFPTRLFRGHKIVETTNAPFSFFGPTCDSLDTMEGPFFLPNDVAMGDYIEIGQLGAYGITMRTNFNGFYSNEQIELEDEPMLSMYNQNTAENKNTIAV